MERRRFRFVFAGGGSRVVAFIGSLKFLIEKILFEVVETAGSSAGALIAFLVCVGKTPDEILKIVTGKDLANLIDLYPFPEGMAFRFYYVISEFLRRLHLYPFLRAWKYVFGKYIAAWLLNRRHARSDHLFRGAALRQWVEDIVKEQGVTYFKDLKKELVVVTFDFRSEKLILFSKATTPETPIALAIAASMTIWPFYPLIKYREPISGRELELGDGGFWDKYPYNIFDARRNDEIPTIGFRLVSSKKVSRDRFDIKLGDISLSGLSSRLRKILVLTDRFLSFQDALHMDRGAKYWTISVDTEQYAALDVSLTREVLADLLARGRAAAEKFLERLRTANPPPRKRDEEMEEVFNGIPRKKTVSIIAKCFLWRWTHFFKRQS